jgi:hypothetical protein
MTHLSDDETYRFYNIWFPLLHYVNQKKHLVPSFPQSWKRKTATVSPEVAIPVRQALWADDSLREAFITENPAKLSLDDLAIVGSWQRRIEDGFFIYRYTKNYTVFLTASGSKRAYGVLGLVSPIEEILGPYLPILVQTVLLPFEDHIIYDGLMTPFPGFIGSGIKSSLKDAYRDIEEKSGIIISLAPDAQITDLRALQKEVQARNKKLLTAFQKELGKAGLTPKMMEEHTANVADFGQEFLAGQKPPHGLRDMTMADIAAYQTAQAARVNLVSLKRFVQFLRDTDRIDHEQARNILDYIKHQQRG